MDYEMGGKWSGNGLAVQNPTGNQVLVGSSGTDTKTNPVKHVW